jgi:hypothetical protein
MQNDFPAAAAAWPRRRLPCFGKPSRPACLSRRLFPFQSNAGVKPIPGPQVGIRAALGGLAWLFKDQSSRFEDQSSGHCWRKRADGQSRSGSGEAMLLFRLCSSAGPFSPVVGRPPPDAFDEGVGKDKRTVVADFQGNGFNGLLRGGQEVRGPAHAQIGNLVHGAPPELAPTEPPEVFVAVACFATQAGQGPFVRQVLCHTFPKGSQLIGLIGRMREAQDVGLNQIRPFLNEGGLAGAAALVHQTQDRRTQRQGFKAGHDGRRDAGDRLLLWSALITYPAKFPTHAPDRLEGVEGVGGQQTSEALTTNAPAPVNKHPALSTERKGSVRENVIFARRLFAPISA